MTFLEELARSSESSTSVWHQFVVSHDPNRDDWYLFVEGELDAAFYKAAFRSLLSGDARIIDFRCGNKRGVQNARLEIRRTHSQCNRVLFFMDKDLDDLLLSSHPPEQDVFCTHVYSVENYLVTQHSLDAVWQQLWMMPADDPAWLPVQSKFAQTVRRFHALMLPVMAWSLLARKSGSKPNLNNMNLGNVILLKDCEPRLANGALRTLLREASCEFRPRISEWLRESRQLRSLPPKSVVRGKFELWIFCRFLRSISDALRGRPGVKPSASIPLNAEGIALALLGKIPVPSEVLSFLTRAAELGLPGHCQSGA